MADAKETTKAPKPAGGAQGGDDAAKNAAAGGIAVTGPATPDVVETVPPAAPELAGETEAERRKRIERDRERVVDQITAAGEAVARQNAGKCPGVVGDDKGPGTGRWCSRKIGHEGQHAA